MEKSEGAAREYAESIINTVREPLIILDQDLRVVSVSRSFYEYFKVKPEETIGQLIYDLGNKQWDIPKLRELLETILPQKTTFDDYEVEHDFAAIGRRIMLLNARQIESRMSKERIILLAIEDITERKEIEAGLEKTRQELAVIQISADEAHEFTESIINTVREPLIALDQDLRVVSVSRSFYEFFKVKPEETIGQLIYNLGNNQWDIPKLRELLETILPQQTTFDNYEVEHDFAAIGRRIMLLNARQIQRKLGAERIILLAIEDITERKMAEEALRVSEEKYRTVADFTYAMETWRTPDGKYQYVSPSCERITGYTVAEFLADPNLVIKITHPEDQSKVIEHYKAVDRGAGTQNMGIDFRILTPNGDIRWIGHSCTAVHDGGGAQLGRRESNRDITKCKRAEEEKEKLEVQNRLLQKAESLSRMAGAIAHHFNNKLHVVMGHLEMAMDSLPQDEKSINNLTAAMQAADLAAEVSRSMLTYLGHVTGARAPLDLSAVCRRSLPLIQAALPKNVVLEMDLPSPGPTIIANSNQIQLILTNLISNSWEAVGDTQGKIQLTVKTVSSADIPPLHRFPINWQADDKPYSCLEVRDTGCGIPDNDLDEAFDPFFSTKFTGRGLGLSVVLGLVQVHSGVVTIESTLGQGSVFRVFFPMTANEAPFQQDKELKTLEIPWAGTVLLVDDDEIVLDITSAMLSMLGFEVLSARDGIEAVEQFQQRKDQIRFVLTDFAMPRMNGLETLTALRQIAPGFPVILASGFSEEQVMEGTHPELPQAFLGKPYGFKDLKDAIGRALAENKK